jgi:MFS transporter, DHA2 family, methylenomycin A resistance protein
MRAHGTHKQKPGVAVLAPIFAGTFIALLDLSIVIVALPTIQNDLNTDVIGAQWVVDAFVLPLGALLLSGGALGDRYGRKRIFLGALALFLAGSVICAAASTLGVLLAGRVVQGIATAAILPGALSLVTQLEPDPQRRARLIGIWAMVSALSFVLGPLLGGALVDTLGWQAIFYVNVPIVLAAITVGIRTITESADPDHASLDPIGQLAAACALGTLTYAVIEGRNHGWGSGLTIGLFAAAAFAAASLILVELPKQRPMLPVRLFSDPRFAIVNTAALALGLGGNGSFFLLSLYLQQARGHSAFTTGLLTLPLTLAAIPGAKLAGNLTAEHGPRRPMLAGFALTGAALLAMIAIGPDTAYLPIAPLFALAGCGQGLAIPATMAAALEIVPRQRSGVGSATVNAARQTGTLLGIAILGTILADHIESATPPALSDAFVNGLQPGFLTAGLIVLASAALLVAMPTTRRERTHTSPPTELVPGRAREPAHNPADDAPHHDDKHELYTEAQPSPANRANWPPVRGER